MDSAFCKQFLKTKNIEQTGLWLRKYYMGQETN